MEREPITAAHRNHEKVHGPTQKYYYLKMKEGQRICKAIIKMNPANPDKNALIEIWDSAQHFLNPPSADLKEYIIDYDNER